MDQGELAEPPSPSCKKQWCGFLGSEIKTSLHGADVKGERFLGVPCCHAVPRASGKPRGSREGSRVGVVAAETSTNPGIKEKGSALGFTAVSGPAGPGGTGVCAGRVGRHGVNQKSITA